MASSDAKLEFAGPNESKTGVIVNLRQGNLTSMRD